MTTLQQEARALGDPTRHAIFRYIAESDGTVDVAELTEHFGFNHNAIRQHLTKLVDVDLVAESTALSSGRGRPRRIYRVGPTVENRWGVVGPYERLSTLLSEIIRTGDTPEEVGRRAAHRSLDGGAPTKDRAVGRAVGRTADRAGDPVGTLVEEMERAGFAPRLRPEGDRPDGHAEIVLENCPFATAAISDPDTICSIHRGLAHGIAERAGGIVIDELVPSDPFGSTCVLRCHPVEGAAGPNDDTG